MAQIFPIDFDEKLTIAQDDFILFSDSEDGNKIKKAQYSNLKGEKGDTGTAATITVGSTTTGTPGSSASVVNSGTTSAAVLDFTIPEGEKGDTGDTGASIVSAEFDGDDMVFTKDDGNTVTLTDAKVDLKGDTGDAATISVGTTTTLSPGSSATVTNSGTTGAAVFNFGIPEGEKGDTGDKGDAATISVGTTTTGEPGTSASVTNSGTTSDAVFNFTIPKGAKGDTGATGTAATISVGSTTTGEPGTDASVTNSGTSSAAVFDFTIPQGEKGDTGTAATISVGTVTTGAEGSSATVTNSGTSSAAVFDFSIPKGDTGATGSAATISVGTTSTLSPGSSATVTNSGTSSAAVFEFGIPQGQTGATGNGIQSITSSKSGKITTVTVTETNGDSSSFQISDGQDGEGSGDVLGPSSSTDSHFALFDGTSGKLIKNGGTIVDVLNSSSTTDALSANQGKELNSSISTINGKIPSSASTTNQLADKNYVDTSINSVTAYYITKNAAGDQFATYAELAAATTFYSGGVVRTPTRNDYCIVQDDENHDDATTRYIYQGSQWEYQYTVNETALTSDQIAALNSGITAAKVSTYDGYATTIAGKQDTLIAGTNISIASDGKTISATDTTYSDATQSTAGLMSASDKTKLDGIAVGAQVNTITGVKGDAESTYRTGNVNITPANLGISSQTAYTTKGTATKVPTITTNTLGQVTAITETNITFPVTSVNGSTGAVTVNDFNPSNAGSTDQVLTKTADGYEWQDPSGSDYSWVTKTISGGEVELGLRTIVNIPGSDFTLTAPATLSEGEEYVIRIISEDNYTMTLGTGFTNPRNVDTSLSFYATDQFVFLAVGGVLELQPLVATGE